MHFFPPPDADLSAEEIARKFQDRKNEIRLATVIQAITWSFWCTWGIWRSWAADGHRPR